jgi:hypothetical protein
MADQVDTSFYRPFQPPPQQNLLQLLQIAGMARELQSRQSIGDAYSSSVDPATGELDYSKLRTALPQTGFYAPEAVAQGIANSSAAAARDTGYQQTLRGVFSQFATQPTVTDLDLANAKQRAAASGVPGGVINSYAASMPPLSDQKGIKNWAVTQANTSAGPASTTTLVPGAVNEQTGVRPMIPAGSAVRQAAAGGLVPELPLGEAKSREASTDTAIALRARNANYAQDMYPINGLIDSLEKVGPKGSGPGKEELNTLKSALYAFSDWIPGLDKQLGDPEQMADFAKGVKYAKQLASSVANNVGPHTNEGLTTAFASSPNMSMQNLAAKDLAKSLYGLRNMQQVMMIQAQKEGVPDSQLTKWMQNNWSLRVNPAGFMWDRLDDTERNRVIAKIDAIKDPNRRAAEMSKLRNSVKMATGAGVIAGPQQ